MKTRSVVLTAALAALLLTTVQAQTSSPLDDARAALKANDLPKAETLLASLTGPETKDAAAFFTLGQVRERQKNLKEAVTAYEQATKLDATVPEYFSTLGVALSQRMSEMNFMQQAMTAGKMKKAFEKSVALGPNHVAGLIGLSRYYAQAPEIAGGSLEKAREFAERVRALVPYLGEIELGNIAIKAEDSTAALAHFEAAVQLKPESANLHSACGQQLVKLGRKDEARARFETALKLNPALESAKNGLAGLDAVPAKS